MSKKFHIKTYGCQMNVYDSVRMGDVLAPLGYEATEVMEDADLILLNTCHIREKAAEKVYSELGRIRLLKERHRLAGRDLVLGVAGCVAQAEGEAITARAPYVDLVMGSQSYHQLPELLARTNAGERHVTELEFPTVPKFDQLPETRRAQGAQAFVAIQEGCDKFCTFCVVPYTRGAEYSRSVADIEREVREQVELGALEVTLLGQNVNAYHGDDGRGEASSLAALIRRLSEIEGLKRIRYTTSHPSDMTEDLYRAHAEIETLMPYLHLPVQSGSDSMLKRMNRRHNAAEYIAIIERLRGLRPDIAFSSDFIVGFPGETEEEFSDTMRLVETVGYASAFSFKYSARPGTPAADLGDQVAEEVKEERLARLQALIARQQHRFNIATVGRTMDVLFERKGRKAGQWLGKSPYMQSVIVEGMAHDPRGGMGRVHITEGQPNCVMGELAGDLPMMLESHQQPSMVSGTHGA